MGPKKSQSGGGNRRYVVVMSILVVIAAVLIQCREIFESKTNFKAAMTALFIQTTLFSNIYFGAALLMDGFSGNGPPVNIDIGYENNIQLKFIWLSRYFAQDQFLFSEYEQSVFHDIERRLKKQYKERNYDLDQNNPNLNLKIDEIDYADIKSGKIDFLNMYVRSGIPVVIKNFQNKASREWTPKYFATKYPNHVCDVINTSSVTTQTTTLAEFYSKSVNGEPLYLRSLSNIFDVDPSLLDEVGLHEFDAHMQGQYLTSQIFMNTGRAGTGTSYHCANFNNIFFQIRGRKRWTFVDPNYTPLMYPMYNAKSMDMASFLTTVALANQTMMDKYFPLYKLVPKATAVLEPGDVLLNPQFNWHMIDNLESESIGVATRWFFPEKHVYQNSLHSTLQWFSTYMWKTYYSRVRNRALGLTAHTPSNTPPMDERFNYGRAGSSTAYEPRIFPASFYEAQGKFATYVQQE
jgi:hypothetical protein